MDSALEKVGLYDFFGVFLTGIIVVFISLFLKFPLVPLFFDTSNTVIDSILFILECYFIGIVLEEIGSILDSKLFKFQKKARSNFLKNNNKIISNKPELLSFRHYANEILGISESDHSYTTDENEYVFFYMKSLLEIQGKSDSSDRINSLYGMSRSLFIAITLCLVLYVIRNGSIPSLKTYLTILFLLLLIFLFFIRTVRFSMYRVRKILRLYVSIKSPHS